ncbi:MAG: Spy/CpxP family protein refolding chaperone [Hyphomicrobiaceae bacterium]
MSLRMHRWVAPALLAVAIPTLALAQQAQTPAPAQPPAKSDRQGPRLSPEARAKLVDGRMAMIRETLKLNDAQFKLWQPIEAQLRSRSLAREQRWTERRQAREQGAQRPALPDRLDRASEAMAKRATDMKAFADVFRPFYASLSDEQKALSRIVLREGRDHGGSGHHRWANR